MSESGNSLSRWLRKLSGGSGAPAEPAADAHTPIGRCQERSVVEIVGELTRVEPHREENRVQLEADIADKSGTIQLIWMGRGEIPGITVGRRLRLSGRVAKVKGRPTVFNPRYELLP